MDKGSQNKRVILSVYLRNNNLISMNTFFPDENIKCLLKVFNL
jgi:hypothetical protein